MPHAFYSSEEYKKTQSVLTKENWRKGIFNFRYKREKKICVRKGCGKIFEAIPSNPKFIVVKVVLLKLIM